MYVIIQEPYCSLAKGETERGEWQVETESERERERGGVTEREGGLKQRLRGVGGRVETESEGLTREREREM